MFPAYGSMSNKTPCSLSITLHVVVGGRIWDFGFYVGTELDSSYQGFVRVNQRVWAREMRELYDFEFHMKMGFFVKL